ncbi:hypothetical protein [Leadbetterella sp. DM7]|uniref:hypothetical protein n=1 Tax=Leadbetterella sp. DM7 TaxID=3235085 RepID=UPI00349EBD75
MAEVCILGEKLIGEQLSSVEFVQDYLQLHFDDKYFIIYVWPKIIIDNRRYSIDHDAYRNKLCSLIGLLVSKIEHIENESLKLVFENEKGEIEINLNSSNPEIVSEIAIFSDKYDDIWMIFD